MIRARRRRLPPIAPRTTTIAAPAEDTSLPDRATARAGPVAGSRVMTMGLSLSRLGVVVAARAAHARGRRASSGSRSTCSTPAARRRPPRHRAPRRRGVVVLLRLRPAAAGATSRPRAAGVFAAGRVTTRTHGRGLPVWQRHERRGGLECDGARHVGSPRCFPQRTRSAVQDSTRRSGTHAPRTHGRGASSKRPPRTPPAAIWVLA